MVIKVNGKNNDIPENVRTIAHLLAHFQLENKMVIVEQNGKIVDKIDHDKTDLHEKDQLELVHFVGGG